MELTNQQASTPPRRRLSVNPSALPLIGMLISGLLIVSGLLFRTYTVSMPSASWEAARQLGLPFIVAEVAVVLLAFRRGLDLTQIWQSLPKFPRRCLVSFLGFYWVGAALHSELGPFAFAQNVITLIHLLFGVAVYHSVTSLTPYAVRGMAKWLAVGLSVFCAMIAFAFINHPPLSTMPDNEIVWQFIIPGFISVRLFGAFCGAIFCFLLAQLLVDEERGENGYYQYLWLTLCAGMMIWSGTRAAIVGTLVTFAIIFIAYRLHPQKLTTIAALLASLVVGTLFAILLIPYNDPAFMLFNTSDAANADNLSGGRLSYWTAIWKAYQSVPAFGAGPFASFWILPEGQVTHVQPHNILLQFLTSWGILATVPALCMLGYATWKVHAIAYSNRMILPFLAMLDCLLVMSLFDGMLHFAQHFMLVMICFGVIIGMTKLPQPSAK